MQRPERARQEAWAYVEAGNYDSALAGYDYLLMVDPSDTEARELRKVAHTLATLADELRPVEDLPGAEVESRLDVLMWHAAKWPIVAESSVFEALVASHREALERAGGRSGPRQAPAVSAPEPSFETISTIGEPIERTSSKRMLWIGGAAVSILILFGAIYLVLAILRDDFGWVRIAVKAPSEAPAAMPDVQATITAGVSEFLTARRLEAELATLRAPALVPTPDLQAIVARQVEASLAAQPTPTPAPTPDMQMLVARQLEALLASPPTPAAIPEPTADIQLLIDAAVEAARAAQAESQGAGATTSMNGDIAANTGNDGAGAAALEANERGGLAVFDREDQSTPVAITSPVEHANVSAIVDITAVADEDKGIALVEFFVDGVSIGLGTLIDVIDGVTGDVVGQSAPAAGDSFVPGVLESNDTILAYKEPQGVTLTDPLHVDIDVLALADGPHTFAGTIPGTIGAEITPGTVINSHFIHFDPVGTEIQTRISGSVSFTNETIIGIIAKNRPASFESLDDSDFLGFPGVTYPTGDLDRGLETGGGPPGDIITLSADRRTLDLDLIAKAGLDHVRLITVSAGVATAASYSVSWDSTTVADGPHTIDARATNGGGNISDATGVMVTVDNLPPLSSGS